MTSPPMLKPPTARPWPPLMWWVARSIAASAARPWCWIGALRSWKPTMTTSRPLRRISLRNAYSRRSRPSQSIPMSLGPELKPSAMITGRVRPCFPSP